VQYVVLVSGWGGEIASKVSYLEPRGSVWVFKLAPK
jgi:hypothetical protein